MRPCWRPCCWEAGSWGVRTGVPALSAPRPISAGFAGNFGRAARSIGAETGKDVDGRHKDDHDAWGTTAPLLQWKNRLPLRDGAPPALAPLYMTDYTVGNCGQPGAAHALMVTAARPGRPRPAAILAAPAHAIVPGCPRHRRRPPCCCRPSNREASPDALPAVSLHPACAAGSARAGA